MVFPLFQCLQFRIINTRLFPSRRISLSFFCLRICLVSLSLAALSNRLLFSLPLRIFLFSSSELSRDFIGMIDHYFGRARFPLVPAKQYRDIIPRSRFKRLVYVPAFPYSDTYYPNSNRQRLIAKQ